MACCTVPKLDNGIAAKRPALIHMHKQVSCIMWEVRDKTTTENGALAIITPLMIGETPLLSACIKKWQTHSIPLGTLLCTIIAAELTTCGKNGLIMEKATLARV